MMRTIMTRQKVKSGKVQAIRKIVITITKEETDAFSSRQSMMRSQGLPHFIKVERSIGSAELINLWYEPSIDQEEFITDIRHRVPRVIVVVVKRLTHTGDNREALLQNFTGFRVRAREGVISFNVGRESRESIIDGNQKVCVAFGSTGHGPCNGSTKFNVRHGREIQSRSQREAFSAL